jgi:hypothetical protein
LTAAATTLGYRKDRLRSPVPIMAEPSIQTTTQRPGMVQEETLGRMRMPEKTSELIKMKDKKMPLD